MNKLEQEMISLLKDLKENHSVCGVKAEFEAEGASVEEIRYLKEIISSLELGLTIKIGGCEAVNDLVNIRDIGVEGIVAPLVESDFALKKFIGALNFVYSKKECDNIRFYINIESVMGYKNIDKIISIPEFKKISGIIMGRSDFVNSLNYSKNLVDSDEILNYANILSKKIPLKEFVIGGNVSKNSVAFLQRLFHLSKFETRKIVFNYNSQMSKQQLEEGIIKALKFELLWLKNKQSVNLNFSRNNLDRIKILEDRCL